MSTVDTTAPTTQVRTTWQIDPAHSLVEFSVRHMMISTVKGRFTAVGGTILDIADDPGRSSVRAEIDAASITTGDSKRDEHLRSADFFDVERYPTITFTSTRVEPRDEDRFRLIGELTLHGQTRQVELDATLNGRGTNPWGQEVAGFTAEAKLNRKDFGLNWNVALEAGGVLVGDQLKVQLEIEAVKQAAS
jgi:polyisoprenoid-binding protein YceI